MRRPAFTLVQLVTVLAMCGILACLLIPGLNSAQEDQRRKECSTKLRDLGIAFHNYHDVNGYLPPGEAGHSNGVFALTMPYMEKQNIVLAIIACDGATYQTWLNTDLAIDKGEGWWKSSAAMTLCGTVFADYTCPSADPALFKSKQANSVASMRYSISEANSAVMTLKSIEPGLAGPCTYAASAGVSGHTGVEQAGKSFGDWREGMFTANSNWTFVAVLDGNSNTLALGEYLGNYNAEAKEWTMRGSWAGAQTMWTAKTVAAKPQEATWDRFSGPHPDVTLFTMGDASVRAIRNSIELEVLRDLSGMREGHVVNFDDTNK